MGVLLHVAYYPVVLLLTVARPALSASVSPASVRGQHAH
jgi:hypothetical protein